MCLFFSLLPTDLQRDVLFVWLYADDSGCSLLKVLAALDMVCSQSDRPSLHFLMDQLPAFGDYTSGYAYSDGTDHTDECLFTFPCAFKRAVQHKAQCLQWLASRRVPVKTLLLTGSKVEGLEDLEPTLTVPSVETLLWKDNYDASLTPVHLSAVLRCLPNLTAIRQASYVTVDATLTPKLEVLSFNHFSPRMPPFIGSCPQLRELRINFVTLTAELANQLVDSCPNLQLLEVSIRKEEGWVRDIDILLKLVPRLLKLEELYVHGLHAIRVRQFVAFSNIKRFSFAECQADYYLGDAVSMITNILRRRPDLECLTVYFFAYSRVKRLLELPAMLESQFTAPQLAKMMQHVNCDSLEALAITAPFDCDMLATMADKMDGTLKSLTFRTYDHQHQVLQALLERNGSSLTNLDWNFHRSDDCPLQLIAANCSNLVTLSLILPEDDHKPKEDAFSAVFAACPGIKELKLETYHCPELERRAPLRAIVSRRMRLSQLRLVGAFNQPDVAWFRQQIRDHQLLPQPEINLKEGY